MTPVSYLLLSQHKLPRIFAPKKTYSSFPRKIP